MSMEIFELKSVRILWSFSVKVFTSFQDKIRSEPDSFNLDFSQSTSEEDEFEEAWKKLGGKSIHQYRPPPITTVECHVEYQLVSRLYFTLHSVTFLMKLSVQYFITSSYISNQSERSIFCISKYLATHWKDAVQHTY